MIRLALLMYRYVDFDTTTHTHTHTHTHTLRSLLEPKNDQNKLQSGIQVVYIDPYTELRKISNLICYSQLQTTPTCFGIFRKY